MQLSQLPQDTARRMAPMLRILGGYLPTGEPVRVLDVGGHPGTFAHLLRHSHPAWEVVTVDHLPGDELTHYVQASGADLPFPEASFDAVVSADTLEHVPPDKREAFLRELRRVARHLIVLCAPMAHPATAAIERQLDEAHRQLTGRPHPWLGEHVAYGLPQAQDVARAWNDMPMRYTPNAPLESWTTWQWLALIREQSGALDDEWHEASRMAAKADADGDAEPAESSHMITSQTIAPHYRGFFTAWVNAASAPEGVLPGTALKLPSTSNAAAARCLALSHALGGLVRVSNHAHATSADEAHSVQQRALLDRLAQALTATENELKRCQMNLHERQREGLLAHLHRAIRSRFGR